MIRSLDIKNEDGFTLLEMLVAVTVLAVGLLSMAGLQTTAIKGNAFGIKNTEAIALLQQKMEDYKSTPYANIAEGIVTEANLGSGGLFTRTSTVQKNTPTNDTKTITVAVSWKDFTTHSFSFRTIVSKD